MRSVMKQLFLSVLLIAAGTQNASAAGTSVSHVSALAAPGEISWKTAQDMHAYRGSLRVPMIVDGITNQGWIVGRWMDAQGNSHWFLMNPFLPAFSDIANHRLNPQVRVLTVSQTDS